MRVRYNAFKVRHQAEAQERPDAFKAFVSRDAKRDVPDVQIRHNENTLRLDYYYQGAKIKVKGDGTVPRNLGSG